MVLARRKPGQTEPKPGPSRTQIGRESVIESRPLQAELRPGQQGFQARHTLLWGNRFFNRRGSAFKLHFGNKARDVATDVFPRPAPLSEGLRVVLG